MKIIDILNKKADGTLSDGFEFIYEQVLYKYYKNKDKILNPNDNELGRIYKVEMILNDKVRLIKEE